jgi:hypothetical protein
MEDVLTVFKAGQHCNVSPKTIMCRLIKKEITDLVSDNSTRN